MKPASSVTGAGGTFRSLRRAPSSWSMRAASSFSFSAAVLFDGSAARERGTATRPIRHTPERAYHRCQRLLMKGSLGEGTARLSRRYTLSIHVGSTGRNVSSPHIECRSTHERINFFLKLLR